MKSLFIYSAIIISVVTNLSYVSTLSSTKNSDALTETILSTNFVTVPMQGSKITIPKEIFPQLALDQNFIIAQEYQCIMGRIESIEWKIIDQNTARSQVSSLLDIPCNNLEVSCAYVFSTGKELHLFATSQTAKTARKKDIAIYINFVPLKNLGILKNTIR